jgi:hypothetical protein
MLLLNLIEIESGCREGNRNDYFPKVWLVWSTLLWTHQKNFYKSNSRSIWTFLLISTFAFLILWWHQDGNQGIDRVCVWDFAMGGPRWKIWSCDGSKARRYLDYPPSGQCDGAWMEGRRVLSVFSGLTSNFIIEAPSKKYI